MGGDDDFECNVKEIIIIEHDVCDDDFDWIFECCIKPIIVIENDDFDDWGGECLF